MAHGTRKQSVQSGLGLEGFQFLERAVKSAFDPGVMAGQAVGLRIEHVDLGLEDGHAAEIPGRGHQFVKQSLLD